MLFLYNIIINIIYFFASLVKKGNANDDLLWAGRFGMIEPIGSCDIWLHAASVGEVKVIGHLITFLQNENSQIRIHITTMTRTGYKTAAESYLGENISFSYFPFDTKQAVKRTFEKIKPKLLVIAETEIWPNTILEAAENNIPIILINGRMSEKAFSKYKLFRNSFSDLLSNYDKLFLKSDTDCKRFRYFHLTENKTEVVGDMKFDAPLLERTQDKVEGIRRACGIEPESFILVAGSTRPGEEEILADLFKKIFAEHKTFNLIIAPRHIERIGEIKSMLNEKKIPFKLYGSESKHESVILVDKLGLLNKLYLAANISFVGGTLVDIGGHNLLEPVWAGSPVLFGPSTYNVKEAEEYIIEHNFGFRVARGEELYQLVKKIINGQQIYSVKTEHDLVDSPTSITGQYILGKLNDV